MCWNKFQITNLSTMEHVIPQKQQPREHEKEKLLMFKKKKLENKIKKPHKHE